MQNRREFILRSSLAVAAGALGSTRLFGQQAPAAAAQPPTVPVFTPIRRNIGTFTARGGTMGWLVTPDAVLVVDSQFADTAQMFLDGLKTRTPRKIDLLLNTHHHPDHTGGNKVLRPMVTKIVAHENVPGLQKKQAAAAKTEDAQAYADETFKDGWKVDIGKEKVSTRYYGPGHTSGDAVIFFQEANIVHMGDLMSHQRHPRVDRPAGASIRNWLVSLEKVTKDHNNDTIYIFGHSKVGAPVTGPKQDLLALRDYFSAMLDYVQKGIKAGKSADEIIKAGMPQFAQNEGTPALQVCYDELTAKA
ncbi:MAG TPA: MBL fold metallo-hydrolase [Vicinamibacterales bacterium]|jgi:glyoxylase-like metal-dependent hydrolase (beta-lactamase superfamily II)